MRWGAVTFWTDDPKQFGYYLTRGGEICYHSVDGHSTLSAVPPKGGFVPGAIIYPSSCDFDPERTGSEIDVEEDVTVQHLETEEVALSQTEKRPCADFNWTGSNSVWAGSAAF